MIFPAKRRAKLESSRSGRRSRPSQGGDFSVQRGSEEACRRCCTSERKKYDLYGSKHRDGIILFPLAEKQAVENLLLGAFSPVDKKRQLSGSALELAEERRACLPPQCAAVSVPRLAQRLRLCNRRGGGVAGSPRSNGVHPRLQARIRGKAFPHIIFFG